MRRNTYYVNAEHTGRAPTAYYGDMIDRDSNDFVRITLAEARRMRNQAFDKRPGGAGDAWANAAGRAVCKLAGCI